MSLEVVTLQGEALIHCSCGAHLLGKTIDLWPEREMIARCSNCGRQFFVTLSADERAITVRLPWIEDGQQMAKDDN